jgi:hypothetical protein
MSNKNAISEIKSIMKKFGFLKEESFLDAKLEDGTVVRVEGEELVEGAAVFVVTEEGDVPAPDAVHTLEDGTKVETKEGVVVKIEKFEDEEVKEEVKEEEKVEMEEEIVTEVPEEVAVVAEPVVEAIVEAIVPVLEEVKALADEMKKMKEDYEKMKNDFSSFKKEPAGKKITNGVSANFNKTADALDNKVAAILAMRNNL